MASYSFTKEAKVYLVHGGIQYNIDISAISFSQTFVEESYNTKTIQSRNLFDSSVILRANPANFEFTFPAIGEDDLRVSFDRALDYDTFDLYIQTRQDTFKLEYCVITSGIFIVERPRPLSMSISGEGSKLTRAGDDTFSIPGTPYTRAGTRTYNIITYTNIVLDGDATLSQDLISLTIELQNNISWVNNITVSGTCGPGSVATYPTVFTIDKRILSGTITRYLTDTNNAVLQGWSPSVALLIEVGYKPGANVIGFRFNMSSCSFTNRLGTGDIYTQSYDWRLTQNPTNLSDIVEKLEL